MEQVLKLETHSTEGKLYKHESKSIVATQKMMMKNSSEAILEKTYIRENFTSDGNIFHVKTHSEKYGKENATLKINKDMNSLVNDISINTNTQGTITNILNKHDVLDKWEELKKRWKKEADKKEKEQVLKTIAIVEQNMAQDSFISEITCQGALHLLFSGLYGSYPPEKGRLIEKDIPKFLVTQPLPLDITYQVAHHDKRTGQIVIEGQGALAENRLDKETLNKLVRTLKDSINMKVSLQVSYKERFEFDKYHWLTKARQEIKVKIPGLYMTESEQTMQEIDSYAE